MAYANSQSEYLDLGPLQTRIETHRLYSERPDDVERAVLDAFSLAPADALLDVGSGTGSFLARLRREGHRGRLVGLDTSPAAIEALAALERIEAVRGDAAALPFGAGEFAAVTARHMLYHVSEPAAAVREAHRVLAPGGWFVASVNIRGALPQTVDLLTTVVARHGVDPRVRADGLPLRGDDLPGLIAPVFGEARLIEHRNALVYPTADAFARYAVSMLGFYGVARDSPARDDVVRDVVAEAHVRFAAGDGPLREVKGVAICVVRRA